MSQLLARKGRVKTVEMKTFAMQTEAINKLSTKTTSQNEFVADCLATIVKINARLGQVEREQETLKSKLTASEAEKARLEAEHQYEELQGTSQTQAKVVDFDASKDTITPASMVRVPDKFDGLGAGKLCARIRLKLSFTSSRTTCLTCNSML